MPYPFSSPRSSCSFSSLACRTSWIVGSSRRIGPRAHPALPLSPTRCRWFGAAVCNRHYRNGDQEREHERWLRGASRCGAIHFQPGANKTIGKFRVNQVTCALRPRSLSSGDQKWCSGVLFSHLSHGGGLRPQYNQRFPSKQVCCGTKPFYAAST